MHHDQTWGMWNRSDHYLGSLAIDDHYVKRVMMPFMGCDEDPCEILNR